MRKLILILLIFVCKLSDAQVYQLMPQYGYDAKRMKFDSTLQIPTTCGVPTLRSTYTKYSAIAFDTCNNRFYVYNSKTLVWDTLKGGTGGGGSTPSLQQVTDVGNTTTNDLYVEFSPGHIVSGVFTDGSISGSVFRVYSNGDSIGVVDSKVDIQINNNDVTRNKVLQLPVKSGVIAVVEDVIDSLKRSRDSVFARKNGQWNFQYKDSIGAGGVSTDTTSLSNRINNAYTTITKLTDTSFFLTKPNTLKDTIRFNKDVVYTENPILTRVSNDSTIIYLNSDSLSSWRNTGYVPYVGATQDVDLGANKLSAKSVYIEGTNGNGHLHLKHQNADATATGQSTSLYADSNGDIKWKNDGNFYTTLKTSENTANRVYTYPNATTTLIGASDTATMLTPYLRKIDTTAMLTPYLRKIDTAVFDRKSAAAYTFRANNTGSSANITDQTFRQSGMQTYTGTIAFGGTAPSGATNHTYNFTQVGNLVTLNVTLIYATAGTSVTTITLPLPADCPAPKEQTGLGATNDVLYYGVFQSTSNLAYSNTSRNCVIRKKSATVGDVELTSTIAASNNRFFSFTIQYFAN